MIKATIGLVILVIIVAFWLTRSTVRVGREVYEAATKGGAFPPLGKGMLLREQAVSIVRSLLDRVNLPLVPIGSTDQEATRIVNAYYALRPSFFNGHYGQDPLPLSLAAAALALDVGYPKLDTTSPCVIALLQVMSEVEQRGDLYAFNALDAKLLEEASQVALRLADVAEKWNRAMGLGGVFKATSAPAPSQPAAPAPPPRAHTPTVSEAPVPAAGPSRPTPKAAEGFDAVPWAAGFLAIVLIGGLLSSIRQPTTSPEPAWQPSMSQAEPARKVAEPAQVPAPEPWPRDFTVLPNVRAVFLADGSVRDISQVKLELMPREVGSRSAIAFEAHGQPYVAEFRPRSDPERFFPAFLLAEAVKSDGAEVLRGVHASWPVLEARVEGKHLIYELAGAPPCRGTLRVAANRLIELKLCGEKIDSEVFNVLAGSLEELNPSTDILADSTEDALRMTFRAIRDQLDGDAQAAFVAEQRAWVQRKEDACRPHGLLSDGYFQCLDMQVASRLALLRQRVALESGGAAATIDQPPLSAVAQ